MFFQRPLELDLICQWGVEYSHYKIIYKTMDKYKELLEKIKKGEATKEEEMILLNVLNVSVDAFKILLEEVKKKQSKE